MPTSDISPASTGARPKNIDAARLVVLGAICGDIIGSHYEFLPTKRTDFKLFHDNSGFTDDTVCTIAVADAIVSGTPFEERLRYWCRQYPRAGYGRRFVGWIYIAGMGPYNSWGNGSAMRVSPVGACAGSFDEAMTIAKE